jgi:Holliday junction resolvasome RuvABC DNA-binding subunit
VIDERDIANDDIAEIFEQVADLLDIQEANPFRIQSYRRAARTFRQMDQSIADRYRNSGEEALTEIEGVGPKLAGAVAELVDTGRLGLLEQLQSELSPTALFERLPGVGEELARRIHDELGVETLEELEEAAYDGRLERVEGIGAKKINGIRNTLAGVLSRSSHRRTYQRGRAAELPPEPPVDLILEIDETYRTRAEADELERIAPKRFNPDDEAWLPVMETSRRGWSCTVLYSNTQRAHQLGKTDDWVVVYYERDGAEDQCTVVTATSGDLEGHRVVRGREWECREYYESQGD